MTSENLNLTPNFVANSSLKKFTCSLIKKVNEAHITILKQLRVKKAQNFVKWFNLSLRKNKCNIFYIILEKGNKHSSSANMDIARLLFHIYYFISYFIKKKERNQTPFLVIRCSHLHKISNSNLFKNKHVKCTIHKLYFFYLEAAEYQHVLKLCGD